MYANDRTETANAYLVGRTKETALFGRLLNRQQAKQIIHIYGTAGVGKSFLLAEFEQLGKAASAWTVSLDGERMAVNPQSFCKQIRDALKPDVAAEDGGEGEEGSLYDRCLDALRQLADRRRVVLLLDTYERMDSIDQWLRDYFLKQLDPRILVVIAGRTPLPKAWFLSPVWRQAIVRMPLSELSQEDVEHYARINGLEDAESAFRLWSYSKGHPLTLSLIAFFMQERRRLDWRWHYSDQDTLPYIVEQWLREVPDDRLRPLIEAASVLREFNQESLGFAMEEEVSNAAFFQLIRFSFVSKASRGWTLHALMREAVQQELMNRAPHYFERLRSRAMRYYYDRLAESPRVDADSSEAYELMYYIGNSLIRAFMSWFDHIPLRFEPADSHHLDELERYVAQRRDHARDTRVELYDKQSNRLFEYAWTKEQAIFTVQWLDFRALFELGYDVVRVMRDSSGSLIGVAVIIPINRRTLPYLTQSPRGRAYFTSLSPEQYAKLAVADNDRAGWFIETIDTDNFSDASQQTAIGYLLFAVILSGELVIESPAPLPYFIDTHYGLGFEAAPNGTHTNYDGVTPAPTFTIRMNKRKLLSLAAAMAMPESGDVSAPPGVSVASPDQADVQGAADASPHTTGVRNVQGAANVPGAADAHTALQASGAPEAAAAADRIADRSGIASRIADRSDITSREKEVAQLLAEGLKNAEIAGRLYISEATVKKHMKSMLYKLEAANRTQLLKKLLE